MFHVKQKQARQTCEEYRAERTRYQIIVRVRSDKAGKSIFKIYSRQYHKITIEDNFV